MNDDGSPAWWVWLLILAIGLVAGIFVGRSRPYESDSKGYQEDSEGGEG